MMKTPLLLFVFTVALCLNKGFSQPDCSSFSDWNGSTIGFTLPYSGDVNIFVFNEWGQQVLLISEPGVKGQNNIALNFSALAQGIYILRLLDSWGTSQVVRLVKN